MRILILGLLGTLLACGGGTSTGGSGSGSTPSAVWAPVTAAIQAAAPQFDNGVAVEVITPEGLVYSSASTATGSFDDTANTPIASASKWVSATVILRLVDQGVLSLDDPTSKWLTDRKGHAWSGNLGRATLRHLLSYTTGISGYNSASELDTTLTEAVYDIYDQEGPTAAAPGTYFYYGPTHLRIAARMAEMATGKTWSQIFDEQLRIPLGWASTSNYDLGGLLKNPNPAGSLRCTGQEYVRFLAMELRGGLDGSTRLLPASLLATQRSDQWGAGTSIAFSPYSATDSTKLYHYGLGNWLETQDSTQPPSATNPILRVSSTGKFGWAPWVAMDGAYAGLVITRQDSSTAEAFLPSENLKVALDPLIRAALAQHPPVIRTIP
jgi:CubicO group peptidase (beta-lactamase class C family)